ncbi:hypothetical protein ACH5RR_022594 [Cinchona calisaya]|uniref:Protein FAR1-RELATED SEQUENCE n=1 Tax=Cinchona calisaya TaxID=153742 RepID=A0ABD2ZBE4_9GENT
MLAAEENPMTIEEKTMMMDETRERKRSRHRRGQDCDRRKQNLFISEGSKLVRSDVNSENNFSSKSDDFEVVSFDGKEGANEIEYDKEYDMEYARNMSFERWKRQMNFTIYTLRRMGLVLEGATGHTIVMFALKSRGYENVGFVTKDLYNKIDAEMRKEIAMGDAEGTIGYLSAKKDVDSIFFYNYYTDEQDRLQRLFWADSHFRIDYSRFGDVFYLIQRIALTTTGSP